MWNIIHIIYVGCRGNDDDRSGYGPRLPFLVISPYAKVNYVDHQIIDQTSIIRFIEDNWNRGRIGNQSFDIKAGCILNMFNITTTNPTIRNLLVQGIVNLLEGLEYNIL